MQLVPEEEVVAAAHGETKMDRQKLTFSILVLHEIPKHLFLLTQILSINRFHGSGTKNLKGKTNICH